MAKSNGQNCTKIEKIDILSKVEYWFAAVICGIVGSNPPVEVVEGFVHCIFSKKSIDKVVLARKGVFLVRFTTMQDKLDVTQRELYFFDKKPFI